VLFVCVCVCVCVQSLLENGKCQRGELCIFRIVKIWDGSTWDSFFGKLKINTLNAKSLRSHMETRHQCQLNVFLGGNTLWYYAFIEEE
ncbi:hypothetical protein WDU94_008742, partial [Cyamophila willieti]